MKRTYTEYKFRKVALEIVDKANDIIEEYQIEGMNLTLRQLYYQFVSLGYLPNKQSEYSRLGGIINRARLAGLIDWDAIIDRTRNMQTNPNWNNPGEIIRTAHQAFKLDHWEGQACHIEVWIEKEALIGVINTICKKLDVGYFACKGFVSQSEMYAASQRLIQKYNEEKEIIIIHLGDHDPSGIDMTRDIEDRLNLFFDGDEIPAPTVLRIALNMPQIEELKPPPNPAKTTDSRFSNYEKLYGKHSWELDALEPRYLRDLIESVVLLHRNEEQYQKQLKKEIKYKNVLSKIEQNWETLI